ncbi:Putative dTDP-rhamnosyltransferase [Mycobacteroides abscessus subsp. abscessus]|nr:Putative dTDP-rhamnosyltransferase [Mycobacteroides abscessus subsp. abscessus]
MRRAAFDSIDGFDSRYFMYMEDVDFGKGHAAGRHPERMLPAHHASAYRFQADRHPHWWQAPLRLALRAGLAIRSRLAVRSALRQQARERGR